ncbi:MAG: DUF411 domain-containing protein [Gemmatimonadaceae bacterium]|nr:DUF411 domain-containing protein [Gemmatimonadaceae bacterium]
MTHRFDRRDFLRAGATALGGVALGALAGRALGAQQGTAPGAQALPTMTVYKSPSCGCCGAWVDHAKSNGFTVRTVNTEDLATVKRELGVPARLASCHTVVVGSYIIEGHVPAGDVKRLLTEKAKVRGLAVPGMPIGSPGMEQGPPSGYERYDVLAFETSGAVRVFASHGPPVRR